MLQYIVNFFGNLCEMYICISFYSSVNKARVSKKAILALGTLFTVLQFMNTNLFLAKSNLVMVGTLVFTFLFSLLFETKWHFRLLESIFLYLTLAIPEVIIAMILSLVFKLDVSYTQENIYIFAICTLSSKFLSFLIVKLMRVKKIRYSDNTTISTVFRLLPLPIASFLILILFLRCCYQINDSLFHIITLLSTVILIIANVSIFHVIEKQSDYINTKEKLDFAQNHIKNQTLHYEELYKYQTELRLFKHNEKNKMLSLSGLIRDGNTSKALKTIAAELDALEESSVGIINSGNPVIDAVIQSKLNAARSKNIDINVSTRLSQKIVIDEIELGVIIGNALDNAIEATEKINPDERNPITISMITVESRIFISIQNSSIEKIDTKNLVSTKSNSKDHGYGLKSIQLIADKYDGMVSISCENHIFSIDVNMSNSI